MEKVKSICGWIRKRDK